MVQYGSRMDEKWLYCEEERNTVFIRFTALGAY